ncbi:ATP-binding cassette domain-containing protein [Nocardia goodfellowii]|uniref:ATP-binding cassette subfamily C protein CydC n=1 Tax=Nocardia goodfellowii TaxID=882446 RepID=A0ABS4Q942_9NOCA|nr:ATP-binding cassette domain-containing protein [Nocardia goodfellowii]MBP2187629.1 ATP-binding cassette subfamily C protein CydC [Nocardia goodfellowii]
MNALLTDLRRIRELLELSRWRMVVSIGWGVLALGSGLGLAALAAWLIARAWEMPPVLDLTIAVVTVRALGISRGLCRYLERLATHDVALRAMSTARTTTYRVLAAADIWRPRRTAGAEMVSADAEGTVRQGDPTQLRRGELLGRVMGDIDDLGAVVVRAFVPIAVAVILALFAIGLLLPISVPAALILAAALMLAGVVAPWLSARAARAAEVAVRTDRTEFTAAALTVLDHAPELRVAGRLETAVATTADAGRRAVAAEDRAASRSAWAAAATPLSIGVSVLASLLIGIMLYGSGTGVRTLGFQTVEPGGISPMALTVLVLLPLSAFEAVAVLPAAAQALTNGRAALRRITRLESGESAAARMDLPELPAGRRIAVVGPSGSGKTTLLMHWAGLFDTPRPDVTFFAEDAHLFGTTVLENLRVARGDVTEAEAGRALRAVGLGDWLESLPEGLHTDLVGGAAAVSGGQRRRLLLARALLSPARTLLLDEPTEHLEAEAGAQLLRALLDPASGLVEPERTVVVVTHQLPAGHEADAVVRIDAAGQVTMQSAAWV